MNKRPASITIRLAAMALSAMLCQAALAQPAANHKGNAGMAMPGMNHNMPGNMDIKAMMKDSNDQMANMPMSGDPDIDFAMMMRIHHQGGVDMAKAQLRDGKNPQMRKMARDIIAAQNKEIAQFDKFLASRGHPVPKN